MNLAKMGEHFLNLSRGRRKITCLVCSCRYDVVLKDSNTIAQFTVLDQGCSAVSLASAMSANNPAVLLLNYISALSVMKAAELADMKSRLDLLSPNTQSLQAGSYLPAKITFTGICSNTRTNLKAFFCMAVVNLHSPKQDH